MAEAQPRQVMTVTELAAHLRIHRTTVYRLLRRNALPGAFKLGGDWRFNRTAIDAWQQEPWTVLKKN